MMLQLEQEVVHGELGCRPAGPGRPCKPSLPSRNLRACWHLRTASELLEFGASCLAQALHKPPGSGKERLMLPLGPSDLEEQSMFPVCLCSHTQSCPAHSDPMDCCPLCSSVRGFPRQQRRLE